MKKLLTMMLCTLIILSLAACSKAPTEDEVRGEQITKEATEDKEVVNEENADETTSDEITKEDAVADEETVDEENVEADKVENEEEAGDDFSLGSTDGLVYESAFIGLGCTLPGDWTFYSDAEIMQLNNYTASVMGEEYEALLKDAQLVYDMYAVDGTGMNSINVTLEKIDNRTLMAIDVADIYSQNATMFEEMYTSMGYSNVKIEQVTFDIEGEEFDGIELSGEINGFVLYQKCFGVKCNGYLASIAITAYNDENITDTIISNFYLID